MIGRIEDYKLSELKAICETHDSKDGGRDCFNCEIHWFCVSWFEHAPMQLEIIQDDEENEDDEKRDN